MGFQPGGQAVDHFLGRAAEHGFVRVEVVPHRADGQTGGVRDPAEGGAGHAVLDDHREQGVEHLAAALVRVAGIVLFAIAVRLKRRGKWEETRQRVAPLVVRAVDGYTRRTGRPERDDR